MSFCKHVVQDGEDLVERVDGHGPELLDQPLTVNGSWLIEDDESILSTEATRNSKWIEAATGGEWRDDDGP